MFPAMEFYAHAVRGRWTSPPGATPSAVREALWLYNYRVDSTQCEGIPRDRQSIGIRSGTPDMKFGWAWFTPRMFSPEPRRGLVRGAPQVFVAVLTGYGMRPFRFAKLRRTWSVTTSPGWNPRVVLRRQLSGRKTRRVPTSRKAPSAVSW